MIETMTTAEAAKELLYLSSFKDLLQSFNPNTPQLPGSSLPVGVLGLAIIC
jgi:hypothetical protein